MLYRLFTKVLYGRPKKPFLPRVNTHRIEQIAIEMNGVRLEGWIAQPNSNPIDGGVIYFNGRHENPTTLFRYLDHLPNHAMLVFHSRGIGSSAGIPSEGDHVRDGLAILDWYANKLHLTKAKIVIVGRSLGSGTAVTVASFQAVGGLVLISPYDCLLSIVTWHLPLFPSWLMRDSFESVRHIAHVQCPILAVVGAKDKTIPPSRTWKLIRHAKSAASIISISVPYGRHRGLLRYSMVRDEIANFVRKTTYHRDIA